MANLFTSFAKGLASLLIGRMISKVDQDPEVIAAYKDMNEAEERARQSLKMFCIRNPDHPKCKDLKNEEALKDQTVK